MKKINISICGTLILITIIVFMSGCNPDKNHIQLPSNISTQPETEIKTEPSTESPTENQTEPATENFTEPATEKPSKPTTEKTTEPVTEAVTEDPVVLKKNTLYLTGVSDGGSLKNLNIPEFDLYGMYRTYTEDIPKERSFSYEGVTYDCIYSDTVLFPRTVDLIRTYSIRAEGETKCLLRVDMDGNITGWIDFGIGEKAENKGKQPLTEKEIFAIADEYAAEYIDLNEYVMSYTPASIGDENFYFIEYDKIISGIPSADRIQLQILDIGVVRSFSHYMLGRIPQNACTEDDVNRATAEVMKIVNQRDSTNVTSREIFKDLIPVTETPDGIIYGLLVTFRERQMDEEGNGTGCILEFLYVLNGVDAETE